MLNKTLYDHYWTKGWVVVPDVFSHDEMERMAELSMAAGKSQLDSDNAMAVDQSVDGNAKAPRKIDQPFLKEPRFRDYVLDQQLRGLVEALIGRRPLLFADQIFMKPPHFGSSKPYHQDNFYFRLRPKDHVITAWIAMDDVNEENGCLRYIDGSHRESILPHDPISNEPYNLAPPEHLIDRSRESLALVDKGGVVCHHVETLHTSHRNESSRWRRAYATHWVSDQVTSMDEQNDQFNQAYFKQPELAPLFQAAE